MIENVQRKRASLGYQTFTRIKIFYQPTRPPKILNFPTLAYRFFKFSGTFLIVNYLHYSDLVQVALPEGITKNSGPILLMEYLGNGFFLPIELLGLEQLARICCVGGIAG